ncbi:MAG: hypothetical protein AVO39_07275 [delta proteobacterium MLS_D]|nr:MAG: hypothetical protein AVO39_07275 [delta proteobacterium MLS_D]
MADNSDLLKAQHLLVRGTNWIGDVIMSLPALKAVKKSLPDARIEVLAKPWVADLYRLSPCVDDVIVFRSPGMHDGVTGKFRLAGELNSRGFDAALLLQNAIEAAIITFLARIPVRAGYSTDGRRFLLTHPVKKRKGVESLHQMYYYLEMVQALGFNEDPGEFLIQPDARSLERVETMLREEGVGEDERLVGIAPGAAYGPAKIWFADRFAALADRLMENFSVRIVLLGSGADADHAVAVSENARHSFVNLAGRTSLAEAVALISRCSLFVSNDSGLMHLAGGLDRPLIAVFGSTDPRVTSPLGARSHVVYRQVSCSPCFKKVCPGDFRCMDAVTVDEVYELAVHLLAGREVSEL